MALVIGGAILAGVAGAASSADKGPAYPGAGLTTDELDRQFAVAVDAPWHPIGVDEDGIPDGWVRNDLLTEEAEPNPAVYDAPDGTVIAYVDDVAGLIPKAVFEDPQFDLDAHREEVAPGVADQRAARTAQLEAELEAELGADPQR